MNKIKDFIYDKSDIVVALVIIAIASAVIVSRIDAIVSYPASFSADAAEPPVTSGQVEYEYPTDSAIKNPEDGSGENTGDAPATEEEIEMFAIYINYGEPLQVIADKFTTVGLFETSEDFFDAVEAANAGTQIKTGNFIIPSNAKPEEIMEIIVKPGL